MARDLGDLIIRLALDTAKFEENLGRFEAQAQKLRDAFTSGTTGLTNFDKVVEKLQGSAATLTERMEMQRQKVSDLNEAYQESLKSKGEDAEETKKLGEELDKAWEALTRTETALALVNEQIDLNSNKLYQFGSNWEAAGEKIKQVGERITSVGDAITRNISKPLFDLGKGALDASIEFESAFAGVRKTVDASEEQFAVLSDSIKDMSEVIPKTTTALSGIMELGGQLGVPIKNLEDFTAVIAKLEVSTNLTEEAAATMFAQFANVTQMDYGDFNRMGATIVDLGNKFATTEADILSMAQRLAAAGTQVGMSQAEIIGFATTLSSVGIQAQAGGSSVSKLMVQMKSAAENGLKANETFAQTGMSLRELQLLADADSDAFKEVSHSIGLTSTELKGLMTNATNLENFAEVVGVTGEQFTQAFREDAAGAIMAFLSGLANLEESGGSAIVTLEEMGLKEIRLRNALLSSTNAIGLAQQAMETANVAWEENIALNEEAERRFATTESKMEMLKNSANNLSIEFGDVMIPTMSWAIEQGGRLVQWLGTLDDGTKQTIVTVGAFAVALGPVVSTTGKVVKGIGDVVGTVGSLSKKLAEAGGTTAALGNVLSSLSSPLGVVAAVGATVGLMFVSYKMRLDEASEKTRAFMQDVQGVSGRLAKTSPQLMDVNNLLSSYGNSISDLAQKISETESAITEILRAALSEQRGLRQEELSDIQAYKEQWIALQEERLSIYQDRSEAIRTAMQLEMEQGTLTKDAMVQYQVDYQEALRQTGEAEKQIYYARIEETTNFHQATQTLNTEAHTEDLANDLAWMNQRREQRETQNTDMLTAQNQFMQEMVSSDEQYWMNLAQATERYSTEGRNALERFLMQFSAFHGTFANDTNALIGMLDQASLDTAKAYLEMAMAVKDSGGQITTENENMVRLILSAFGSLVGPMGEAGAEIMRGLIGGQEGMLGEVYDTSKMTADEIIAAIREALDMHSPSVVMTGIGEDASQSLIDGITNKLEAVRQVTVTTGTTITSALTETLKPTQQIGANAIENTRVGILSKIVAAYDASMSVGKRIVEGLWDGIQGMQSWISARISEFVDDIIAEFELGFGIRSPSTEMRDRIGKQLVPGIVQGVEETSDMLDRAMEALAPKRLANSFLSAAGWKATGEDMASSVSAGLNHGGALTGNASRMLWDNMSARLMAAMRELKTSVDKETSAPTASSGSERGILYVVLDDSSVEKIVRGFAAAVEGLPDSVIMLNRREIGRTVRGVAMA